jgi:hypothetical protein
MPRKKKTATDTNAETIAPAAASVAVETTAPAEAAKVEPAVERARLRSWVTDPSVGYERFTDEKARLFVLHFAVKPEADILAKLKEAGFRYQPEYLGQPKVWTRRKDYEGQLKVEALEAVIRGEARRAAAPF